jgi:hypothetical protein
LRTDGTGKTIGGGLISRGHLYDPIEPHLPRAADT